MKWKRLSVLFCFMCELKFSRLVCWEQLSDMVTWSPSFLENFNHQSWKKWVDIIQQDFEAVRNSLLEGTGICIGFHRISWAFMDFMLRMLEVHSGRFVLHHKSWVWGQVWGTPWNDQYNPSQSYSTYQTIITMIFGGCLILHGIIRVSHSKCIRVSHQRWSPVPYVLDDFSKFAHMRPATPSQHELVTSKHWCSRYCICMHLPTLPYTDDTWNQKFHHPHQLWNKPIFFLPVVLVLGLPVYLKNSHCESTHESHQSLAVSQHAGRAKPCHIWDQGMGV